ncbi:MAG TPA: hypothetical protein VE733_25380 [Streptosporangiaceae bacterium]|nr:hypothetical protein [Streptosporangiaceae bacterium]
MPGWRPRERSEGTFDLPEGTGPGFCLSGAIVALAMAAAYLVPLRRALLREAHG